jgi:hypothetical protein
LRQNPVSRGFHITSVAFDGLPHIKTINGTGNPIDTGYEIGEGAVIKNGPHMEDARRGIGKNDKFYQKKVN